jgi:hypothetical protein
LAAQRLRRFVGDPYLGQKAAGIELCQYAGIDRVGFDLRMRNKADLLRIGDDHPADVRADHRGDRGGIAGCLDHDDVVLRQLLCKCLQ